LLLVILLKWSHIFVWTSWDRGSQTFCPAWPRATIRWISATGVARITSVSHCTCLYSFFFKNTNYIFCKLTFC
jgi:hypothetical protein